MNVACVLVTHLPMRAELRRHPELAGRPTIIYEAQSSHPVVFDYSREVKGAAIGAPLQHVLARCRTALLLQADIAHYREIFEQMVSSLLTISPTVEPGALGCVYTDIRGMFPLFRSEEDLIVSLQGAIDAYWCCRIGLAEGKFAAYVAALRSTPGGVVKLPRDVASYLAPLSIDLLPLKWEHKSRLHRLGIHLMGQLASLSVGAVQGQLGPEGVRAWELAQGRDSSPVVPVVQEQAVIEYLSLPFCSTSQQLLFAALESLLRKGFARPEMRGRYVRRITLQCSLLNALTWTRTVTLKEPAGSPERAYSGLRSILAGVLLPGPIEDITLTLTDFTHEQGVQARALSDVRDVLTQRRQQLIALDQQLAARMNGRRAIYRLIKVEPGHPLAEMRALMVPVDPAAADQVKPLNAPMPVIVHEGTDHRPQVLITDRRRRDIVRVDDAWSLDMWWMPRPVKRSYLVLVQKDGSRVTVFRDMVDGGWYMQKY